MYDRPIASGRRVDAVIFDLDGVLIDSERVWNDVRRRFTEAHRGRWRADAQKAMMGMSSAEWSTYMHDALGVAADPEQIVDGVVRQMVARYREQLPLLPGAQTAVRRVAARWPLGLASSANRPLIDLVLHEAGLHTSFAETLSTDEVGRGKPAPDAHLEVAHRLGVPPGRCAGIEDSTNGLLALRAAGLRTIAIPNRHFPPDPAVMASADAVISHLDQLTVEVIDPAGAA